MSIHLLNTLSTYPYFKGWPIADIVTISENTLTFHIPIGHIIKDLSSFLQKHAPDITIEQNILRYKTARTPHHNIKNIIAVAAGKGGVGKSTIAYFLAQALSHCGANVGVLDADIYGPSQSLMFALKTKPTINDHKQFIPFDRQGISVMSIGVLAKTEKALMWRGPMISQALLQLYQNTLWPNLDFLIVDMPPGTGDIPITLIQKLPITANVLVSNPHPLAQFDVDKCRNLFESLKSPIITTIMNQSSHQCPHCQKNLITPQITDHFHIPHDTSYQDLSPKAHPAFIDLAQHISTQLTQFSVHEPHPFDTINISTQQE